MKEKELTRGQPITFRIPSDTPDQIIKHLQQLKQSERRNFSSKIAEYVISGINDSLSKQRQTITIPLPKSLDKAQRDWLKHEHSEALLGSIVYQLLSNPIRTASLITSLNSNSLAIEEALYLQEEINELEPELEPVQTEIRTSERNATKLGNIGRKADRDDDLDNFNWEVASKNEISAAEEEIEEEDMDSLLGDFLSQMNK
ncbi:MULTISPECIES: hypothetical protein [Bacillaceae]|jgi:hypothetical protein|uniref:Plasmid segregation centromere-binding protein ParR n=1 Tax=Gottfriedia luciferensis TaxID=178774 RepID=A0ABX2ZRP3_9BACI|nr:MULTISPECIES: hypothetical protein [Bacillaceae]ODG91856.1 hypothetical protein BED47_05075 [Gottfriedia luciferensis]SFD66561.1 hypothetical protein SAMN02799633_04432 [Bacillus sp. UNCCL81]